MTAKLKDFHEAPRPSLWSSRANDPYSASVQSHHCIPIRRATRNFSDSRAVVPEQPHQEPPTTEARKKGIVDCPADLQPRSPSHVQRSVAVVAIDMHNVFEYQTVAVELRCSLGSLWTHLCVEISVPIHSETTALGLRRTSAIVTNLSTSSNPLSPHFLRFAFVQEAQLHSSRRSRSPSPQESRKPTWQEKSDQIQPLLPIFVIIVSSSAREVQCLRLRGHLDAGTCISAPCAGLQDLHIFLTSGGSSSSVDVSQRTRLFSEKVLCVSVAGRGCVHHIGK